MGDYKRWRWYSITHKKVYKNKFANHLCLDKNKGRKRNLIHTASNIDELIRTTVIPKWREYLKFKSERGVSTSLKPRSDTVWKKILRDVREFFRILFRKRFHALEFKDEKGASRWIQILFDELNIPLSPSDAKNIKLFKFVHQTHKTKYLEDKSDCYIESPFETIEKYNERSREVFMTHYLCSRMFYFVYKNYLVHYIDLIKHKYRKEVVTLICMLLNWYEKMKDVSHVQRIKFLFE